MLWIVDIVVVGNVVQWCSWSKSCDCCVLRLLRWSC